jgi:hypothetical protein
MDQVKDIKADGKKAYLLDYEEYETIMYSLRQYKIQLEKCNVKDLDEIKQVEALRSNLRKTCLNKQ